MKARVSVVMAVYNGERYVEQSLKSILDPWREDMEVVVIDDGSTDRTPETLDRLFRGDRRLTVIRQARSGLATSLNRAIGATVGEYIARQDADDLSLPGRFERQLRYLDRHPEVAAVGTGSHVIDEDDRVIGALGIRTRAKDVKRALQNLRATPVHGSAMLRRRALDAVGGYREGFRYAQDLDLWLRMVERFSVENVPEPLYQWRLNPQGVYATQRAIQLKYCGIALCFARERSVYGSDSYDQLRASGEALDIFAAGYRMRELLYAKWGELLFRGLRNPDVARPYLRRALRYGYVHPKTVALFGWSLLGFPWPGGVPLRAPSARGPRDPGSSTEVGDAGLARVVHGAEKAA